MVRTVLISADGPEGISAELAQSLRGDSAPIYHIDSSHPSFEWLASMGIRCVPMPESGIENGVILVPKSKDQPPSQLGRLVEVSDRLLGPGGCPWDQEQTHESLKKYLIEEAYELCDAIDSGDQQKLIEELGDVLLQPVIHAQMAHRDGQFCIEDVAQGIVEKLIRRHPHVFGDVTADDSDQVLRNWDAIKKSEKGEAPSSILDGVPTAMPSLLRAHEVSKRAARAGFEWPNLEGVWQKFDEEVSELKAAIESGDSGEIESELGDLLFTVVNLARWMKVEPEEALRKMLGRFTERFRQMELKSSKPLTELSPDEWDELWNQAKWELR